VIEQRPAGGGHRHAAGTAGALERGEDAVHGGSVGGVDPARARARWLTDDERTRARWPTRRRDRSGLAGTAERTTIRRRAPISPNSLGGRVRSSFDRASSWRRTTAVARRVDLDEIRAAVDPCAA
jgi:hypothetical protein